MRLPKSKIYSRETALPKLRFAEQQLTSFSGLVVFQKLFADLKLKERLRHCCRHLRSQSLYQPAVVVQCLIVHLLIGFRRFRDMAFYKDDPMVQRLLGLKVLPDVSTVSRNLAQCDEPTVKEHQTLNREQVLERLSQESLKRVTLDFDGSVLWAKRHAEGSAVGFNKAKKGARSYYPLFCMVAQTGQVFDVLHRSGNVHDSRGAVDFVRQCVEQVRNQMPGVRIETRMDSAFFSDELVQLLESLDVEFTISVPFERFPVLKKVIRERSIWWPATVDRVLGFFNWMWKPNRWRRKYRFVFIRKAVAVQRQGPLQLDLFEPQERGFEFKVIVTNKTGLAIHVARFHEGRGQQENVFAELKEQVQMDYLPGKRWATNKMYLVCAILAHNLGRELQMRTADRARGTTQKRTPLWSFEGLNMMRRNFIQRAGRLTRTNGCSTLTMNANAAVAETLENYLAV